MKKSPSAAAQKTPSAAAELAKVKAVVKRHLPAGYREVTIGAFTCFVVPLSVYPDTYNGHALWYVAMGAQKHHCSLYLMNAYGSKALQQILIDGFTAAGKKLSMGKACIRFKRAEDLALDAVATVVAATPMAEYVAMAKSVRRK